MVKKLKVKTQQKEVQTEVVESKIQDSTKTSEFLESMQRVLAGTHMKAIFKSFRG